MKRPSHDQTFALDWGRVWQNTPQKNTEANRRTEHRKGEQRHTKEHRTQAVLLFLKTGWEGWAPHCCCLIAAASLLLPHCCVPFLLLLLLLLPHCCCFCCCLIGIICLRFFHNMICIICKSHFLYSGFTRMCYTTLKCFKNRSFCCYIFYDVQPFFSSRSHPNCSHFRSSHLCSSAYEDRLVF